MSAHVSAEEFAALLGKAKPGSIVPVPPGIDPAMLRIKAPPGSRQRRRRKDAASQFANQIAGYRLPAFDREHHFAKSIGRQWRFDFACPQYWLAVEIEGLVVRRVNGTMIVTGRHATISGFREDARKYASAAMLGWTVLRFEQGMVYNREAIDFTQRVLAERGWIRL